MEMKQRRGGLLLLLLCFLEGASLAWGERMMAVAGRPVTLPCGVESRGDIVWSRNGALLLKYVKSRRFPSNAVQDIGRFSVSSHSTNDLEVTAVKLTDSGTYTCVKEKTSILTTELYVYEVSASPSFSLIMSEDLTLKVTLSPEEVPGLRVSWRKDGRDVASGTHLQMKNVSLGDSGDLQVSVELDGAGESRFQERIRVRGFLPSPAIVFSSGSRPVTIPWEFNFNVRQPPLQPDVTVVEGRVTRSSQILKHIAIHNGAPCWSDSCDPGKPYERLDVHLSDPESGDYRMEVLLELGGRKRRLWKDVCVAALTVSTSEDGPAMGSPVTLQCDINCLGDSGKLCWRHVTLDQEICAPAGQKGLSQEVTATSETSGVWTCSVTTEQKEEVSANVTLKVPLTILDVSNYQFWVMVGASVSLFLVIVVAVSIVTARCRRMRRARHRAWLRQNLHQQKRCECRGFAPTRLKENA